MHRRFTWHHGLLAVLIALCMIAPSAAAQTPATPPDYAPSEVIVKLLPATNVHVFAALHGLKPTPRAIEQLGGTSIYNLQIADGTPPTRKAATLANDRQVLYAEPNYLGALPEARQRSSWTVGGAEGDYVAQWAAATIHLPEAQTISRGAGVTVAVLDTGVDLTHPALAGHLLPGYDFVDRDADPSEQGTYGQNASYGHGTHVAGLIALVAPEAKILPLRTLDANGAGTFWAQAQALRYASDHGADVINLSYTFDQPSQLIADVLGQITCTAHAITDCRAATRPGAVVVAAAGNSGTNVREYPAANTGPGVLAVAASTPADTLAPFSTYGAWVQLAAPGDDILSTIPGGGYATWSGTSMAAPFAAGTAALVRSTFSELRPVEVITRMTTTGARIDSPVRRRLDVARALMPSSN